MTEQQIEEGNKKIEQHNKFCFMKKKLPMYKRIVPLRVPIMYAILAGVLLALPTFFSTGCDCLMLPENSSSVRIE